jgi:UV DNA damage endonuclease
MLDAMGLGQEAVVVTHVGGVYGDLTAGRERWVRTYELLPDLIRRRLVLENDDTRYSVADILWINERCGVPLVFDNLHHWCNDRDGIDETKALADCLRTWPAGVRPKIHFSSPRTEAHLGLAGSKAVLPPRPGQHADFINPFEFAALLRLARPLSSFDIMLEAKGGDLALLRLRDDLAAYAPDVAGMVQ